MKSTMMLLLATLASTAKPADFLAAEPAPKPKKLVEEIHNVDTPSNALDLMDDIDFARLRYHSYNRRNHPNRNRYAIPWT